MAGELSTTDFALPTPAHVVGNAFVKEYYNVLQECPQCVHRFYTDLSGLTRAEPGADGAVGTVVSEFESYQKLMAFAACGDFKAEIVTVDSQDSVTGGVLVMVTGSLSSQLSGKRNFVQSFFLAPQEKGYFVLNDVFRFLEKELELSKQTPILANGIPEQLQLHVESDPEPALPIEHEVREISPLSTPEVELMVEEIFDPTEDVEYSEINDVEHSEIKDAEYSEIKDVEHSEIKDVEHSEIKDVEHSEIKEVEHSEIKDVEHSEIKDVEHSEIKEVEHSEIKDVEHSEIKDVEHSEVKDDGRTENLSLTDTAPGRDEPSSAIVALSVPVPSFEETFEEFPALSVPVPSFEETSEEFPTKSWASILRMKENGKSSPFTTCNIAPKTSTFSTEQSASYSRSQIITITGKNSLDEGALIKTKADGRSVYVKNLPMAIVSSQLEKEFRKFGIVKPGGVNVKSQNQGSCYAFVEFEETTSAQSAIKSSPISIGGRPVYIEEKKSTSPRSSGRGGTVQVDRLFRTDGMRGRIPFIGRGLGSRC